MIVPPSFSSRRLQEDPVCKAGGKIQSEYTLDLVSETWNPLTVLSFRPSTLVTYFQSPTFISNSFQTEELWPSMRLVPAASTFCFALFLKPVVGFDVGIILCWKPSHCSVDVWDRRLKPRETASVTYSYTRTHPLHSGARQMCMSLTFPPCLSNEPFNQTGNKARWLASEIFSTPSPALLMLCSYFGGSYFFGIHWCKSCIDFLLAYKSIDYSLF